MDLCRWLTGVILVGLSVGTVHAEKPNVVVIFADDVGYGDLGCYGAKHVKTPNIDRLASQGRRFTDAHSASAVCSPSRYALITGRYPVRHGNLWNPIFLRVPLVVSPDRVTIADVAKNAGYNTACIGKWHLGFGNKRPIDWNKPLKPGPLELGFDHYFGVPVVNSHPPFVYVEDHHVVCLVKDDPLVYGKKANTRVFDEKMGINQIGGAKAAHALYDDEAVGTTLTGKAVDWIRKNKDKPFFLYLATTNIHHPFTPAKRFQGTSKAGRYGDFIHELDWIVGQVMETLEKTGLAKNTLVIFTSDNGGMLNRGGQAAWKAGHRLNGDLLGFKFDAWEGGHRIPFIARWPGKIKPDSTSNALISNVDLLATVAAVVGHDLKPDEGPDSFNVLPALTGQPNIKVRDHLLIAPQKKTHLTLRQGEWVYVGARGGGGFTGTKVGEHLLGGPAAHLFTGQKNSDIENGKIKPNAPKAQLYNLKEDPTQKTNVIRRYPKVAAKMRAELERIKREPTAPHAQSDPVPVIFDTDITGDVDDVLALAMLHTLADRKECTLEAVTVSKIHPLNAPFVDAVNTFYGRPDIPIGVTRDAQKRDSRYLKLVKERDGDQFRYPHDLLKSSDAPDAVTVLRKTLAKAKDRSVVLIQVGLAANLADLIESKPDQISPLNGVELLRRKVRLVSVMAGAFAPVNGEKHYLEANVRNGITSMQRFAKGWPKDVPVIWSDFLIGIAARYPRESIARDFAYRKHHIVREAYLLHSGPNHDRPTWDLTSVLYAVRPEEGYFDLSERGHVTVEKDGFTQFRPVKDGRDRYLKMSDKQALRVIEAQRRLVSQPPRQKR